MGSKQLEFKSLHAMCKLDIILGINAAARGFYMWISDATIQLTRLVAADGSNGEDHRAKRCSFLF